MKGFSTLMWSTPALQGEYMSAVAQLPCALCADTPVELHHPREDEGTSTRAGDFLVIPLCKSCHTGHLGVHGDKTMLRINKKTEWDLVNDTIPLAILKIMESMQ